MSYRSLLECVRDLESQKELVRVDEPVDPCLEIAEVQRRVFRAGGPAVLFTCPKNCRFPMLGNLFGTKKRMHYLFRDTLDSVARLMRLKVDPGEFFRHPAHYLTAPLAAWHALPRRVRTGPVMACTTTLDQLPQLKCWPDDGGAYVTLPQVYTEDPHHPGAMLRSNLGMYRVQLGGNGYAPNREAGMHYQIHRGIGVHHAAALELKQPLRANVFVGGPPAMTLAAVMPLPEGISELAFAGVLGGRRVAMARPKTGTSPISRNGPEGASQKWAKSPFSALPIHADADFCISGYIDPARQLPEGPFGDHLGYYSLAHDFPVLIVEKVYHRRDAIWPFTVVGRPPQEDSMFGELIHELVGPIMSRTVAGVQAVHAVEAAGVHPLLLAIGSERYVPYEGRQRPRELLTQSNALLGQGQLSLAKYLLIVAGEDNPELDIRDVPDFFRHVLERADWRRDLHFQTCTTIDTLDYSGDALNQGSKVVIAAAGPPLRSLPVTIDSRLTLPEELGFRLPKVVLPGILAVEGPAWRAEAEGADRAIERFSAAFNRRDAINNFPLVVVVDQSEFAARSLDNFLWVTFTRSNPATDVYGIEAFVRDKHWGCFGSLLIDARRKPHHAPPLVDDPEVTKRVRRPGGPWRAVARDNIINNSRNHPFPTKKAVYSMTIRYFFLAATVFTCIWPFFGPVGAAAAPARTAADERAGQAQAGQVPLGKRDVQADGLGGPSYKSRAIAQRRRRARLVTPQPTAGNALASGIDRANFDPSVRFQDDLYRAVNGTWLNKTEIPADRPDYGAFTALIDKAEVDLHKIIEECAAAKDNPPGSERQKVGDLYTSYMDEDHIEKLGMTPVLPRLAAVDAIKTKEDLVRTLAELNKLGIGGPFACGVTTDAKHSDQHILGLGQAGLGLPDRDYYLDPKFKSKLAAYQVYLEKLLTLAKIPNAKQAAADIVALETQIAKIQWSKVENRDAEKTYNKMSIDALAKLAPGFDWELYFKEIGAKDAKEVDVSQPPFFTAIAKMLDTVPLATWKTWLKYHVVHRYAGLLNKDFVDAEFAFFGTTLRGIPQQRPRWKRGVMAVEGCLGEAAGKLYVEKHFPPQAKQRMDEMVKNVMAAYRTSIQNADWLSASTKERGAGQAGRLHAQDRLSQKVEGLLAAGNPP